MRFHKHGHSERFGVFSFGNAHEPEDMGFTSLRGRHYYHRGHAYAVRLGRFYFIWSPPMWLVP